MIADPGGPAIRARTPTEGLCDRIEVPHGALGHLTRAQYDNTVRDLLGTAEPIASAFPGDQVVDGLEVGTNVSPALVEGYFDAADALASSAVQDLTALLGCDPASTGEDACFDRFLPGFLLHAYRRPATPEEISDYTALYRAGKTEQGFAVGVQLVVQATLVSPYFLYRVEPAPPGATPGTLVSADGFVVASRLSYFFWNSMPDDVLFAAADAGELSTPEGVAEQARRLLEDERAHEGLRNFYRQWLELDQVSALQKDPTLFPDFDAATAADLRASLEAQIDAVLWDGDASLESLFTGGDVFVDARLAPIFGMSDVSGDELVRRQADPSERAGILTHPALLAATAHADQTTPVLRGKFVRTQFLCQNLPPPPPDVMFNVADPAPGLSTRERFARHSTDPSCAGCHHLMDPIGFGLEGYDPIGRFRETEEGVEVDTRGELLDTDVDGAFDGAIELSEKLAGSEQAHQCVARQLFRYAVGRTERTSESCVLDGIYDVASRNGWSIPEMMVAVTQTPSFLDLVVPEGGGS